MAAHIDGKPFKAKLDNRLQANALIAIVITSFYGIIKQLKTATEADASGDYFFGYFVIVVNAISFCTIAGTFLFMTAKVRVLAPKIFKAVRASTVAAFGKGWSAARRKRAMVKLAAESDAAHRGL